ncbi:MAG: sugar transferase [Rhodothermaceae bacterium]|nr:sugar transferase [Rhodothermaceae bacterium]
MTRKVELLALLIADSLAVCLASYLYFMARFEWTWFEDPTVYPELTPVILGLGAYWLMVFFFAGMYRERYAASRFDELISILKVVAAGILVLIFAIYIDTLHSGTTRSEIFFYGAAVYLSVALFRVLVRTLQKTLILRGIGTHKALIVGWGDRVDKLHQDIGRYPAAGLDVVGMIRLRQPTTAQQPAIVGGGYDGNAIGGDGANLALDVSISNGIADIDEIPELIDQLQVQDVLITLGPNQNDELMEILRVCDGKSVSLKLVPDFYSVIGGMAKTEHLYGLPLIEVLPAPMPAWEESTKRLIDFTASLIILIMGMPAWILIAIGIWSTSKGPAIYKQKRVGYKGKVFTMLKFRTMVANAEAKTGPVWASENDPRYTSIGRWLRKTRLDEIPQLWNVLKGEMSLVGPRPERPYFVEKLAKEIPLYSRRYRVKPGITGWAQVTWHYDTSLDDVRQKVKYDLFYIANLSLRMDLKILFLTVRTAFLGKGQ